MFEGTNLLCSKIFFRWIWLILRLGDHFLCSPSSFSPIPDGYLSGIEPDFGICYQLCVIFFYPSKSVFFKSIKNLLEGTNLLCSKIIFRWIWLFLRLGDHFQNLDERFSSVQKVVSTVDRQNRQWWNSKNHQNRWKKSPIDQKIFYCTAN